MYITKRDGTQVPFDKQKIIDAINKLSSKLMANYMKMKPQKKLLICCVNTQKL